MIIKSKKLSKFKNLIHGTSTRSTGGLFFEKNLENNNIVLGETRFSQNIGVSDDEIILKNEQQHTGNVTLVKHKHVTAGVFDKYTSIPENDAIITNVVGVNLVVYTADCVPILLYDPEEGVIAAVHAGWRGIVKNIIGNVIDAMQKDFGSAPEDIVIYMGPCLCGNHFEVHSDVADQFQFLFSNSDDVVLISDKFDEKGIKSNIDLRNAVKQQLLVKDINKDNIEIDNHCTWEDGNLYSARQSGSTENSNWSVIGIKA